MEQQVHEEQQGQVGQLELAGAFERSRRHLRAVAFRMLGSVEEAEDAVQEAWLRASRGGDGTVINVTGWLTTIISRVCLDMLRTRRRRGEELTEMSAFDAIASGPNDAARRTAADPESEAMMADSVGLALLVVLDRLGPAERIAFVLHDMFGAPFEEIAAIVDRSPVAAKKLASRARRRVHGTSPMPAVERSRQRAVVEAFLAASRAGDVDALIAVLAPDVVRHADRVALRGRAKAKAEVRGARAVAEETRTNAALARFARVALINGRPGLIVAPHPRASARLTSDSPVALPQGVMLRRLGEEMRGPLLFALQFKFDGDRIAAIDVVGEPARLRQLHLSLL